MTGQSATGDATEAVLGFHTAANRVVLAVPRSERDKLKKALREAMSEIAALQVPSRTSSALSLSDPHAVVDAFLAEGGDLADLEAALASRRRFDEMERITG